MSNSITLKFAYVGTNFTRTYKLDNVATAALANVKSKVQSINADLASSSTPIRKRDLMANFVADEYSTTGFTGEGHMNRIAEVTIVQEDVTKIPLF